MKDTFDDLGFLLPTILVNGTTRRPTISNISVAFQEFASITSNIKHDITVVYLSTHGQQVNGKLYFDMANSRRSGTPLPSLQGALVSFSDSNGINVCFSWLVSWPPQGHGDWDDVVLYSISTSALDPCETAYQAGTCHTGHNSTLPLKGTTTGPGGPVQGCGGCGHGCHIVLALPTATQASWMRRAPHSPISYVMPLKRSPSTPTPLGWWLLSHLFSRFSTEPSKPTTQRQSLAAWAFVTLKTSSSGAIKCACCLSCFSWLAILVCLLLTHVLGLHTQSGWDKGHTQANGVPGGGAAAIPHHL